MKLTEYTKNKTKNDFGVDGIPLTPECGGYLEDLEDAVYWACKNTSENLPDAYGHFATDEVFDLKLTSSSELVKMWMAGLMPEWANCFYWNEV